MLRLKVLAFSFFSISTLFAQSPFKAGLVSGITTTQVDGDGYSGYNKLGLGAGAFVNNKFGSESWAGQMELIYIQKGSKRPSNPEKGVTLKQISLSYVEIPVLVKRNYRKLIYEGGLSYGRLLSHKEFDESGELLYKPPFKKTDIGVNLGLSFNFNENLSINARFLYSILPVRDEALIQRFALIGGSYNNSLFYSLRYQFGKPTSLGKNEKEESDKKIDINKILKIE